MKIHTSFDYPPIPVRNCDWSAVLDDYDGAPDAGRQPHGHGETEAEAINELLDDLEANEDPRLPGVLATLNA